MMISRETKRLFLAAAAIGVLAATDVHAANCSAAPSAGVDWQDCRKRNLILDGSDLSAAKLADADFSSTDLRRTKLEAADLTKADLGRAMLDRASAANSSFEKALGYRTSFANADLVNANFAKSEMHRANFKNANLANANFEKSELGRVDFSGAIISGVDFSFANLSRADLRTAKFDGAIDFSSAYLYLTRVEGVDLSQMVGLEQWQVDMACGDDKTKLPQGISPGGNWPCTDE